MSWISFRERLPHLGHISYRCLQHLYVAGCVYSYPEDLAGGDAHRCSFTFHLSQAASGILPFLQLGHALLSQYFNSILAEVAQKREGGRMVIKITWSPYKNRGLVPAQSHCFLVQTPFKYFSPSGICNYSQGC